MTTASERAKHEVMLWAGERAKGEAGFLRGEPAFTDTYDALVDLLAENEAQAKRIAVLEAVRVASRFRRNILFHDGPGFVGEWVAVPAADFRELRAALAAAEA